MKTNLWIIDSDAPSAHLLLAEAGAAIAAGGTIAFPTETVYGLGADAANTEAVERLFVAKGRPSDNPLIVHIASKEQVNELVTEMDATSSRLIEAFWPGPLALVLPVKEGAVSPRVTAGLSTVAVRMPDHPIALKLIEAAGCPIAAPSANRSGRPSPTLASHVFDDLNGAIDGIVDGGPTGVGVESTVAVVESGGGRITILRPGGVTADEIRRAVPEVEINTDITQEDENSAPRSPGMRYKHYAPQGRLTIVQGDKSRAKAWARNALSEARRAGEKTGVLTVTEHTAEFDADLVIGCGSDKDMTAAARQLYAALRQFDDAGITYMVAEGFTSTEGIGLAFMNRLHKAAGYQVVTV
jgi:L-threonylcarbamoyladenylate synthase